MRVNGKVAAMFENFCISRIVLVALLIGGLSMNAKANIVSYEGVIKERTGALIGIIPRPLTRFSGSIEYDNAIFVDGWTGAVAGAGDILNARFSFGNVLCIAFNVANCAPGSISAPIVSVDTDVTFIEQVYYDTETHTGSLFIVANLETPISLTLSVIFDFDAMSWAADGGYFGTLSGCVGSTIYGAEICGPPPSFPDVPIPAPAWLFASALLGLGAIKRKTA